MRLGPLLGMLLKHKGFSPIIYEKAPAVQEAGLVLEINPRTYVQLLAQQVHPSEFPPDCCYGVLDLMSSHPYPGTMIKPSYL
jgi:hypothetical protein